MLQVHCLPLGDYETNCYILHDQACSTCAVIDPGYNTPALQDTLSRLGLTVDAILLTHGHFDHVGAVKALMEQTGCRLWLSERDWSQKRTPVNAYFYPLSNWEHPQLHFPEEGQIITAGGLRFSTLSTPGHTPGSVCYLCENALFSGDTLFAGSCGRTDLPGGNAQALRESLKRLRALEVLTVYPGHGEKTSLLYEQKHNPYLQFDEETI